MNFQFAARPRAVDASLRTRRHALTVATCLLLGATPSGMAGDTPDATASDPVTQGWMVGTPPAPDKTVRVADGSFYRFPQFRWSFANWRELFPTKNVSRGDGPIVDLPRRNREADLDGVKFTPIGSEQQMTWAESLSANYTDGIVVLHDGRVVYERYFGALSATDPHIAFSVTKSFVGTLACMLIAEGRLDPTAPVSRYIPELADSGFGDATVQQVLDMTTALDHSENYADPNASFVPYARAVGMLPRPSGDTSQEATYDYLKRIRKSGTHGEKFVYRSPNTDVAGWLVARVTGKPLESLLQERIWSKLGAEADAYVAVDALGTAVASGGLNARLRDMARFGEMIRLGGRWNGQQVVPQSAIDEIRRGATR
jgi:hypothetical protein